VASIFLEAKTGLRPAPKKMLDWHAKGGRGCRPRYRPSRLSSSILSKRPLPSIFLHLRAETDLFFYLNLLKSITNDHRLVLRIWAEYAVAGAGGHTCLINIIHCQLHPVKYANRNNGIQRYLYFPGNLPDSYTNSLNKQNSLNPPRTGTSHPN
jgi:hypothetical protein